jgi:hypothetical protein
MYQDLTNLQFNKLKVIREYGRNKHNEVLWECECSCGSKQVIVTSYNLKSGHTKSCGCYLREYNSINYKKFNTYDLSGEYGIGYTSKGEEFYFDLEDYNKIKDYCWYIDDDGYVRATTNKQSILIHRTILEIEDSDVCIDHPSHKKYDNRKSKLRIVTRALNNQNLSLNRNNKSGFAGVYYSKDRNKWRAYININKKRIYLGDYVEINDAIRVRKEAENKYYGEYSYDNSMQIGG